MDLNLDAVMRGKASRLRYIQRFSLCRTSFHESVAEHCYFTSLHSWLVAQWCLNNCTESIASQIDMVVVMERALFHDLEEAVTGDFPRPFKYSTQRLAEAIEEAAGLAFQEVIDEWTDDEILKLRLLRTWTNAKDGSFNGRIVAFADFLSVVTYVSEELLDKNRTVPEHLTTLKEYVKVFESKPFDFIRPLVEQANDILKGVYDANAA